MAATQDGTESAGSSGTSGPVIVQTKLARPPQRAEQITRTELVQRLQEAATRPLTLVTAPPGFGKTTLLAAWAAGERRAAWLSLDDDDNDPARLFVHLVAALQTVEAELGRRALAAQAAHGSGAVDSILALLLNELAAVEEQLVLVLDDYHLITNAHIHEGVAYLVEHRPDSFRLVLATREDPPFPLGRLRARGQLAELRVRELRFSDAETSMFLNDALRLALSEHDIELLQERTEGWPAALYLAALSLQEQPDASRLIETFAGDDRHVVDYLTGEVLARQTPELRSFLLRTSILTRMCGPLCDAVTEADGSARTLDELERTNLLLVPLDGKREWYRYHHLFAELLQHELRRTDGDSLPKLHRRASDWYRDAGLVVEAAHHAYAAGDLDAAVELVGQHWSLFVDQGQLATVSRWLATFPEQLIGENRTLCAAAAMIASHTGRFDEAQRWVEIGDRAPVSAGDEVDAALDALKCWLPMAGGDVGATIAAARRELAASQSGKANALILLLLGTALWWTGELAGARPLLEKGSRITEAAGIAPLRVQALGLRAALELDAEDAAQAEAHTREGREVMREAALEDHPFSGLAHIAAGRMHARHGELEEAATQIERGIRLAELGQAWYFRVYGLLALAEVRHSAHEPAQARRLLARSRAIVEALPNASEACALPRIEQAERTLRLRPSPARDANARYWELSERELAVLRLLATKLSQREIAAELYVSFNTVKTHTRAIFRKLHSTSRAEAVERAHELGLL